MVNLSKSKIITHRQCSKRLWLQTYRKDLIPQIDAVTQARFDEGNRVGDIARQIHHNGIFVDTLNQEDALFITKEAIAKHQAIFEAAFFEKDVLIRADLLFPDKNGYRLVEVKSSTAVKDYHYEDATVQAWVIHQAGINLTQVALAHINNQFVYQGDENYAGLLIEQDLTPNVHDRLDDVTNWVNAAKETLVLQQEPKIDPGQQCHAPFECEFNDYCSPADPNIEHPVHILPNSKKLANKLIEEGYRDLRQVPLGRLDNPKHIRMQEAIMKNGPVLDPMATKELNSLPYPRYYIDFETISFAVPIWKNTRPYMQIPFQWSCHIEQANGDIEHLEFLDVSGSDPRYEFVQTLIQAIRTFGPIIAYNAGFEKSRIHELADLYPDLASKLNLMLDRFFDLLTLARNYYYHPDMQGSWSIKNVLPTIDPELNYGNLEIGDGNMAQEAYREAISTSTTVERKEKLKDAMLKYCSQDTSAMVKIIQNWTNKI